MLRNRFTLFGFLLLLSAVATTALAAPPPGKGGGNGGGDDDGGTGTLPSGLTTRYAVHTIPLTGPRYDTDNIPTDVNENQTVVGYYQDEIGRYIGYRYDAQAGVLETSGQMLDLSGTEIVEVAFIGINNFDAITAYAGKLDGSVQGLLIYPDGAGGWTWTVTEPPYPG